LPNHVEAENGGGERRARRNGPAAVSEPAL
jgi:hypothetical protein